MSADNGYILRQNSDGKYVLQVYWASAEGYPDVDEGQLVFDTIDEAVLEYNAILKTGMVVEYGLTVELKPPTPVIPDTYCTVITAQYIFGVERCGKPAVDVRRCERPLCEIGHPVCAVHNG